jgi:hypothetical protein
MAEEREIKYLDLDGDGVPDAVETTDVEVTEIEGAGHHTTKVEVVTEVDADIDDDGVPGTVEVSDTVIVENATERDDDR